MRFTSKQNIMSKFLFTLNSKDDLLSNNTGNKVIMPVPVYVDTVRFFFLTFKYYDMKLTRKQRHILWASIDQDYSPGTLLTDGPESEFTAPFTASDPFGDMSKYNDLPYLNLPTDVAKRNGAFALYKTARTKKQTELFSDLVARLRGVLDTRTSSGDYNINDAYLIIEKDTTPSATTYFTALKAAKERAYLMYKNVYSKITSTSSSTDKYVYLNGFYDERSDIYPTIPVGSYEYQYYFEVKHPLNHEFFTVSSTSEATKVTSNQSTKLSLATTPIVESSVYPEVRVFEGSSASSTVEVKIVLSTVYPPTSYNTESSYAVTSSDNTTIYLASTTTDKASSLIPRPTLTQVMADATVTTESRSDAYSQILIPIKDVKEKIIKQSKPETVSVKSFMVPLGAELFPVGSIIFSAKDQDGNIVNSFSYEMGSCMLINSDRFLNAITEPINNALKLTSDTIGYTFSMTYNDPSGKIIMKLSSSDGTSPTFSFSTTDANSYLEKFLGFTGPIIDKSSATSSTLAYNTIPYHYIISTNICRGISAQAIAGMSSSVDGGINPSLSWAAIAIPQLEIEAGRLYSTGYDGLPTPVSYWEDNGIMEITLRSAKGEKLDIGERSFAVTLEFSW